MILVAGGTGFVGGHVLRRLREEDRTVRALVRSDEDARRVEQLSIEPVKGDISDRTSLEKAMNGVDTAINLVGIIEEAPKKGVTFEKLHHRGAANFAEAASSAGVKKIIHMSALGTRPRPVSEYHRTKYLGEEAVKNSGVTYTIFRPSAQIGVDGEFTKMMIQLLTTAPVLPVFGDGKYKMQPMDVKDTAAFFAAAVDKPESDNRVFEIGGPEVLTYLELLGKFEKALGKRKIKLSLPWPISNTMVSMMQILPKPPITDTQYKMLKEDNVCDNGPALEVFPLDLHRIDPVIEKAVGIKNAR